MMFYTYIIYTTSLDAFYVGSCQDLEERLKDHNSGSSKSTKKAKDWKLMYFETFETRSLAMKREYEIKRKKSRKYLNYLISKNKKD